MSLVRFSDSMCNSHRWMGGAPCVKVFVGVSANFSQIPLIPDHYHCVHTCGLNLNIDNGTMKIWLLIGFSVFQFHFQMACGSGWCYMMMHRGCHWLHRGEFPEELGSHHFQVLCQSFGGYLGNLDDLISDDSLMSCFDLRHGHIFDSLSTPKQLELSILTTWDHMVTCYLWS